MTGEKLKEKLFLKRGELSEFAKFCGLERMEIASRFKAQNVAIDILKKYAAWKGINEAEFISYATGPETKAMPTEHNINMVEEPPAEYKKETPVKKDATYPENVILAILENQKDTNAALMKIANAMEISAITVAKLNGIKGVKIVQQTDGKLITIHN